SSARSKNASLAPRPRAVVSTASPGMPTTPLCSRARWKRSSRCRLKRTAISNFNTDDAAAPAPVSRPAVPVSIRLDASVLDHLTPFAELDLDEVVQFLGRTRKRFEAHVAEIGFHLAAVDDLAQLGVEQRDDVRRCAGRREDAGPGIHVEPCDSRLVE